MQLPLQEAYFPAGWRYRVRHDGGDEADYVEVGVLEHEITPMEPDVRELERE